MIGWKKVRIYDSSGSWTYRSALLKLDITGEVVRPDVGAEVFNDRGRYRRVLKMRTDKLKVLAAFRPHTNKPVVLKKGECFGSIKWDNSDYTYRVGAVQRPANRFSKDPNKDCGAGLHFFLSRRHAENWGR